MAVFDILETQATQL